MWSWREWLKLKTSIQSNGLIEKERERKKARYSRKPKNKKKRNKVTHVIGLIWQPAVFREHKHTRTMSTYTAAHDLASSSSHLELDLISLFFPFAKGWKARLLSSLFLLMGMMMNYWPTCNHMEWWCHGACCKWRAHICPPIRPKKKVHPPPLLKGGWNKRERDKKTLHSHILMANHEDDDDEPVPWFSGPLHVALTCPNLKYVFEDHDDPGSTLFFTQPIPDKKTNCGWRAGGLEILWQSYGNQWNESSSPSKMALPVSALPTCLCGRNGCRWVLVC